MFASFRPLAIEKVISGLFRRLSNGEPPERHVQALITRMRQRAYPETTSVLAGLWMRTTYASLSSARQRKKLDHILDMALQDPLVDTTAYRQIIAEIKQRHGKANRNSGQTPGVSSRSAPLRASLNSEGVATFIVRLLNHWLPMEIARLLLDANESIVQNEKIPVLTVGTAIERLLVREHLPRETLEMLLEPPAVISAESVYPADLEILRDVVLCLLGRNWAPPLPVMPAALLCMSPDAHLPADYQELVRHAFCVGRPQNEQICVTLPPATALRLMEENPVRLGSIIVTMDGRWWESEHMHCGEQYCVVYRPGGRLQIDYSGDHTKLRVPWPEQLLRWSGAADRKHGLKIFGREWHISGWEVDGNRTWLHLVFSRSLPPSAIVPAAETGPWKLRPASVDIAWTMLGSAVKSSLMMRSKEPIEQLHQRDLIPIGYVLVGLAESVIDRRLRCAEAMERELKALRNLARTVVSAYGRVPWRILPRPVRATLLKNGYAPGLSELLEAALDGVPEQLRQVTNRNVSFENAFSTSSDHAA